MDDRPTLEVIATHLALAVRPLREAVADLPSFKRFLYGLGWKVQDLPPAYIALAACVDDVTAVLESFGDEQAPTPDQVADLLAKIKSLADAIKAINTAPAGVDPAEFLADVGERILEVLLVEYLTEAFPFLARLLELLDVITYTAQASTATRPAYTDIRFKFTEIPRVIADPGSIPARVYGWGTADLEFELIAGHLRELLLGFGLPVTVIRPDPRLGAGYQGPPETTSKAINVALQVPVFEVEIEEQSRFVGLQLLELPAEVGALPGMILQPMVPPSIGLEVPVTPDLRLDFRAGSDLAQTFGIFVRPSEIGVRYPFEPGTTPPKAGFGADLSYLPPEPKLLLGSPGKTRLQATGAKTGVGLDFAGTQVELHVGLEVLGLAAVLAIDDQDGFLGSLFGGRDVQIAVPLGIQWSSKTGITFHGSAGFDVTASPHLSVGPIVIDAVRLAAIGRLEQGQPPKLEATAEVTITGALGPVGFSAEGVGVKVDFVAADGNAGPFDVDVGFKPPNGLGIVVDAGPIAGGGFLSFDSANGRYSGILQLQVYSVALTAIGVLETKLPDGSPGYSFLIIIAGEFPPIQLGYGFTLNGAGGLCGIHRTVAVDVLRAGLKSHSIDHVLFPENPVQNAPQIISDIRTIFPPAQNRFVFGPIAIIGWATPTLIEAELGIFIELPAPMRIVLLGEISVVLPKKEAPIVVLHIDILGVLDLGAMLFSLDGTIYDSHVAAFSITGDMAFRFAFGEPPNLAFSLGGLNPHYQPPPAFPTLSRLTIALGMTDNPRISLQAYFAVTSNTIQIGALAEVYAKAWGFNIYGWLGFDVLVVRSPLSLTADLSGGVALRRGTSVIAGVHLEATLTGPAPWHAKGRACLSCFFFDICVPFDHTFGEEGLAELAAIDPWPLLEAAIEDLRNWSAEPVSGVERVVSLKAPIESDATLLDPVGAIALHQRVLPLNRPLTKFGSVAPAGPDRYTVESVNVGGGTNSPWSPVPDYFAPAQFKAMTDDEKLSRPSFEKMDAGVRLGNGVTCDPPVGAALEYETIVVDTPWDSHGAPPYPIRGLVQMILASMNSAATGQLTGSGLGSFVPPGSKSKIALSDETFVIAGVDDLAPHRDLAEPGTPGATALALADHFKRHPEDRGRLQVVPLYEAEMAA